MGSLKYKIAFLNPYFEFLRKRSKKSVVKVETQDFEFCSWHKPRNRPDLGPPLSCPPVESKATVPVSAEGGTISRGWREWGRGPAP